jgi:hypothetical protein
MEAGRDPIIRENRKINKPRAKIASDPCTFVQGLRLQLLLQRKPPVLHNYYKTLGLRLLF